MCRPLSGHTQGATLDGVVGVGVAGLSPQVVVHFVFVSCLFPAAPGSPSFSTALPVLGTVGLFRFRRAAV